MKGSIGMSSGNFLFMGLGLPNRNRCWLNQALPQSLPKGEGKCLVLKADSIPFSHKFGFRYQGKKVSRIH